MPYYLMFSRDLKLLIKKTILSKETILDRVIELIHKVPIFRKSAKTAIIRAQYKMKANYPIQQIKEFVIGDQVLYDDSPNYHEKLDPK